jgi:sec-independent protein translocase protein TatA
MDLGLPELIIILLIVLLLFGSTRLPKLSRSLGQSIKELREGFGSTEPSSKDKKTEEPPSKNNKTEDKQAEEKV